MGKNKWNYATVRSIFGEVWIGKTRLEADGKKIFSAFEKAEEIRKRRVSVADYEMEDEDQHSEDGCGKINKGIEKFIADVR